MTVTDLKTAILNNARLLNMCPAYQQVMIATDNPGIITAGLPVLVWAYKNGVITDALLAEFSESDLNAQGIYTTGTFSLTNPATDIYILKTASVTLSITGNTAINVYLMGAGSLTLTVANNGYVDLQACGTATWTATLSDSSLLKATAVDATGGTITAGNTTVIRLTADNTATVDYTGTDTSFFAVSTLADATVNLVSIAAGVTVVPKQYGQSIINNPSI